MGKKGSSNRSACPLSGQLLVTTPALWYFESLIMAAESRIEISQLKYRKRPVSPAEAQGTDESIYRETDSHQPTKSPSTHNLEQNTKPPVTTRKAHHPNHTLCKRLHVSQISDTSTCLSMAQSLERTSLNNCIHGNPSFAVAGLPQAPVL